MSHFHFLREVWCVIVGAPRKRLRGRFVGRRFTCDSAPRSDERLMLKRLAEERWKASGLTLAQIKTLGFAIYTAAEVEEKYPLLPDKSRGGFVIPYRDIQGKPTNGYRFRYLGSGESWNAYKKKVKYAQPKDSRPIVYFPHLPTTGIDWSNLKDDVSVSLYITEGELKAACAVAQGIPTIGIGGVSMFEHKRRGYDFLPELEQFKWQGRKVSIVFDSDVNKNPHVQREQDRLSDRLIGRGAHVHVIPLPSILGEEKTGLDDFLVKPGGREAFKELCDKAEEYEPSRVLYELSKKYRYVRATSMVVRLPDGDQWDEITAYTPYQFINEVEVNQTYTIDKKPILAGQKWMRMPNRPEVRCLTYAPGERLITDANELNTWPGWGCEPEKGKPEKVEPFFRLIFDPLTKSLSPEHRQWFLQYLAYPLQHPGAKLDTAVVMWSTVEGNGKSFIGYTMKKIYGKNFRKINEKEFGANFNDWAAERQFIMVEEISGGGENKRDLAALLKDMITQQDLSIHKKYQDRYVVKDTINFYFTSNQPDAFYIKDPDRRLFVVGAEAEQMTPEQHQEYGKWLESEDGPPALFYHLLHNVDTKGFDPHGKAPVTAARGAMIEASRSDVQRWVSLLKLDPKVVLESKATLWNPTELLSKYYNAGTTPPGLSPRLGAGGLGLALGVAGFKQWERRGDADPMPVMKLKTRLWIISTNAAEVAKLNGLSEKQIFHEYLEQHPVERKKYEQKQKEKGNA